MTLKADAEDEQYSRFLKTWELQKLVKKYSDYIRYPIKLEMEKSRVKEETKDSEKPEYETYTENETLNSMVPLWVLSSSSAPSSSRFIVMVAGMSAGLSPAT